MAPTRPWISVLAFAISAFFLAFANAGRSMPAKIPMIEITTSNSISVNARISFLTFMLSPSCPGTIRSLQSNCNTPSRRPDQQHLPTLADDRPAEANLGKQIPFGADSEARRSFYETDLRRPFFHGPPNV